MSERHPQVWDVGKRRQETSLNWDLLVKLLSKKKIMHGQWKQKQVTWGEYKDAARLCRDGVRRTKA